MNEIYTVWVNQSTSRIFEQLVLQGTPTMIIPFIVIVETISNLIRPGTLAVRREILSSFRQKEEHFASLLTRPGCKPLRTRHREPVD